MLVVACYYITMAPPPPCTWYQLFAGISIRFASEEMWFDKFLGPVDFTTEHHPRDHVEERLADEAGPHQGVAQVLVRVARRGPALLPRSCCWEHGKTPLLIGSFSLGIKLQIRWKKFQFDISVIWANSFQLRFSEKVGTKRYFHFNGENGRKNSQRCRIRKKIVSCKLLWSTNFLRSVFHEDWSFDHKFFFWK